eukprot:2354975-Pyramimonas_sp.AAC.1
MPQKAPETSPSDKNRPYPKEDTWSMERDTSAIMYWCISLAFRPNCEDRAHRDERRRDLGGSHIQYARIRAQLYQEAPIPRK